MVSLYHNEGNGLFVDEAPQSEVGRATLVTLGFGCFFFDYDNDGWQDIFVADGHIEDQIERVQKRVSYAEPPHLFRNLGGGKFTEVTAQMGNVFAAPKVARAAAYADIDNDGFLDVFANHERGAGLLVPQRRRDESQSARQTGGREVEPGRHWGGHPRERWRRQTVEDAALGFELPGAERASVNLRPGRAYES